MDDHHFDNLTRSLARSTSRRGLLKGVVVGIMGGIAGTTSATAARAPRQAAGVPCTRATDCASFACVDGVCCDTACTGQCESCATGTCQPVAGAPVGHRPACPGSGPCQATCDGVTRTMCAAAPGADVACGVSTCADGWLTTYSCAGNGACVPTTTNCAPYGCDPSGTACATGCSSHDQCPGTAHCAAGYCVADQALGASCADGADCAFGFCANDVCCNEACDGVCQVCDSAGFCGQATDETSCDGGTCCDGDCVETSSDVQHCGACDHACPRDACHDSVCTGGVCGLVPARAGAQCDDGDPCTTGETCQPDGSCRGNPVVCQPLDQCHNAGVCDATTGACTNPNKDDDTACDTVCITGGACQSGTCTGGEAVVCPNDNPCLTAACDTERGCITTPKAANASCADDDRCDGEEACDGAGNCVAGLPVTCGPCLVCNAADGTCGPDPSQNFQACPGNGNECFGGFVCVDGTCVGADPVTCTPQDVCHTAGTCNPATGACSAGSAIRDCTPCQTVEDCPEPRNSCARRHCSEGICHSNTMAEGEPCEYEGNDPCVAKGACRFDVAGPGSNLMFCAQDGDKNTPACYAPCDTVADCNDTSGACLDMACIYDESIGRGGCEVVRNDERDGQPCNLQSVVESPYPHPPNPDLILACVFDGVCQAGACVGDVDYYCPYEPYWQCCLGYSTAVCGKIGGSPCEHETECCSRQCVDGVCAV